MHTKFELDCVNTFSDNGRKQAFWPSLSHFWPQKDQSPANVAPKRIISEHPSNKYTTSLNWIAWLLLQTMVGNHHFDPFSVIFLVTRGPKLSLRRPKANHFWTLNKQMHTPNLKLIEWLLFHIMVGNPGWTDGRSPILCPLPMRRRRQLPIQFNPLKMGFYFFMKLRLLFITNYSASISELICDSGQDTLLSNIHRMKQNIIIMWLGLVHQYMFCNQTQLEQLERLHSEIPPPPMITHTSDSYHIPSQNKTKLEISKNCQKFKFWNFARKFTRDTPSEVGW